MELVFLHMELVFLHMELDFLHMELVFLHMELVFLHSLDVAACPCRPGSDGPAQLVCRQPNSDVATCPSLFNNDVTACSHLPRIWSPLTSQFVIDCLESRSLMSQACPGLRNRFLGIDS